ncbi:MAG: LysR family transcriptional regulator [Pseudomonadota bacterium]
MIEDYRGLAVFVAVADAGSFSEAGRRLKLSTSVVSHHVSRLEAKLGVSLFFRSTRSLSLAPEGQAILADARRMVDAGETALAALAAANSQPAGSLRISLPAFGYSNSIHQAIWSFADEHPLVALSVNCSDAIADIVRGGFDLAIRLGVLPDSNLKCRRIKDFKRIMVAAPSYLAGRERIDGPEALQRCSFVAVSMLPSQLEFQRGADAFLYEPEKTRLEVDTIEAAKSAVIAGLGVRQLPVDEIQRELQSGELIHILPEWSLPIEGVYAVWPDIGPQKKLTRRLIDYLIEWQQRP